jgi:ATP-dependent protease Clp ATPase subunit
MADIPAKPPKQYPRYPGYCSFCRKNHRDVGLLAEGPDDVFICYFCILACKNIIEEECRRKGTKPGQPSSIRGATNYT